MARCPKCKTNFKTMEDENPADFGCPRCGYGAENRYTDEQEDEDE